jgi:high-affinity iron transporter
MIRKVLFSVAASALFAMPLACSSAGSEKSGTAAEAQAKPAAAAVTPAMLEKGKGIYKTYCSACHGETGKGDGPAAGVMKPPPRDHTDRAYMSTLTDEELAKIIQMGGAIKGKPLMPSNPQIRGVELEALLAFTRSLSTARQQ